MTSFKSGNLRRLRSCSVAWLLLLRTAARGWAPSPPRGGQATPCHAPVCQQCADGRGCPPGEARGPQDPQVETQNALHNHGTHFTQRDEGETVYTALDKSLILDVADVAECAKY